MSVRARLNWNLEVLVFKERGRLENPEKNLLEQEREQNQQQTQPTYGVEARIQTWATLVVEASALTTVPPLLPLHTSTFNCTVSLP